MAMCIMLSTSIPGDSGCLPLHHGRAITCYHSRMEITEDQYGIAPYLLSTRQRSLSNVLNAILYVADRKWRGLPARYGNWHTIAHEPLVEEPGVRSCTNGSASSSKRQLVHHSPRDGTAKKNGPQSIGRSRRRLDHQASYGCRGCPDGRGLLALPRTGARRAGGAQAGAVSVTSAPDRRCVMDRAYEGDATRQLALDLGFTRSATQGPGGNPGCTRRRNEIDVCSELKGFRFLTLRQTSLFLGFVLFALIYDAGVSVNRP